MDHGENWPIIIDSDDLVNDPQQIMDKFCETTGAGSTGMPVHMGNGFGRKSYGCCVSPGDCIIDRSGQRK